MDPADAARTSVEDHVSNPPSPPWKLKCPWCTWYIWVAARGMRGNDQGSGVEAADRMEEHIACHDRTWSDFLEATHD